MYEYSAKVLRVVDGDTVDVLIDLGFNVHVKNRLRLYGIDAWESRTRDLIEKEKGLAAKQRLTELLEAADEIRIVSHGLGKYGRSLATIYIGEQNVNQILLNEGHAVEYLI